MSFRGAQRRGNLPEGKRRPRTRASQSSVHILSHVISSVVERSRGSETITIVYVMRRDEGVPPYRRLRRESDTLSFRGGSQEIQRNRNGNNRPRLPKYPPTVAHRREIPCNRNENERARIINQANTLNALSLRGASATWQSPGRETPPAYPRQPIKRTHFKPRHLERSREISRERNDNNRTRYAAGRGRPALPTASPRIGQVVIPGRQSRNPTQQKRK